MDVGLKAWTAKSSKVSDIFAVQKTEGEYQGVQALIDAMGKEGQKFYKSSKDSQTSGKEGIIAPDDVVLIKINCQWDERGGTNTDLLKSVIQAIVSHPDGFSGEIIVADNGQAQYGGNGSGGSMDWEKNNAIDRSQSVQKVVDGFSDKNKVSASLWDKITMNKVGEYSAGDMADGFIIVNSPSPETEIIVSYPKFKTKYGTYVSFKEGIWDGTLKKYDSGRLKVINMPVLKTHQTYIVTASIKCYMGTTSDKLTKHNAHNSVGQGGMGTQMARTRIPVLNILDAIWINPFRGPITPDSEAVETGIIAASTDPAALDSWAAKYILMEAAQKAGNFNYSNMDPGETSPGYFGYWLKISMDEIKKTGLPSTINMDEISVHIAQ
jgi:hypothetical protein